MHLFYTDTFTLYDGTAAASAAGCRQNFFRAIKHTHTDAAQLVDRLNFHLLFSSSAPKNHFFVITSTYILYSI